MTVEADYQPLAHQILAQKASYRVEFDYLNAGEVVAALFLNGVRTPLVYGTDYSVLPLTNALDGGTLTMLTDQTIGAELRLSRRTEPYQPYVAPNTAKGAEASLDRLALALQEAQRDLSFAMRLSSDAIEPPPALDPSVLKGFVVGLNNTGTGFVGAIPIGELELLRQQVAAGAAVATATRPVYTTQAAAQAALVADAGLPAPNLSVGQMIEIDSYAVLGDRGGLTAEVIDPAGAKFPMPGLNRLGAPDVVDPRMFGVTNVANAASRSGMHDMLEGWAARQWAVDGAGEIAFDQVQWPAAENPLPFNLGKCFQHHDTLNPIWLHPKELLKADSSAAFSNVLANGIDLGIIEATATAGPVWQGEFDKGGVVSGTEIRSRIKHENGDTRVFDIEFTADDSGSAFQDCTWTGPRWEHVRNATEPFFFIETNTGTFNENVFMIRRYDGSSINVPFFDVTCTASASYNFHNRWLIANAENCISGFLHLNGGYQNKVEFIQWDARPPVKTDPATVAPAIQPMVVLGHRDGGLGCQNTTILDYRRVNHALADCDVLIVAGSGNQRSNDTFISNARCNGQEFTLEANGSKVRVDNCPGAQLRNISRQSVITNSDNVRVNELTAYGHLQPLLGTVLSDAAGTVEISQASNWKVDATASADELFTVNKVVNSAPVAWLDGEEVVIESIDVKPFTAKIREDGVKGNMLLASDFAMTSTSRLVLSWRSDIEGGIFTEKSRAG